MHPHNSSEVLSSPSPSIKQEENPRSSNIAPEEPVTQTIRHTSSTDHTPQQISRKLTTTLWEDEGTVCYQMDVNGVCVSRRQDNDMINGTKLLNVVGMSRGKRDGILKNEKGRVVVKVGAMALKGVWITFARAKHLATKYNIYDSIHPLLEDRADSYLYHPTTKDHYDGQKLPSPIPSKLDTRTYHASFHDDTNMIQHRKQSLTTRYHPYMSPPPPRNTHKYPW